MLASCSLSISDNIVQNHRTWMLEPETFKHTTTGQGSIKRGVDPGGGAPSTAEPGAGVAAGVTGGGGTSTAGGGSGGTVGKMRVGSGAGGGNAKVPLGGGLGSSQIMEVS